ncbi:DEAD/DEAH box helicase [Dyadobacter chenwenxiniae]|uniref:DEAD/DEAH box helicase n=1 Tax=Dyadobacter chenwenxiniae TaxID=2906456 RepID=A0A9X1PQR3_9BACT|nr:DEAD/DEAH box helicase [Dyadobacter chenwenxiniae]MCF0063186.1 DEAD/DEAH box helicase [Dyadobacter chenwenxiniae]UON84646.1 DEAD/DEAH box helicase [Dyadobacter chenwenxiniae]
MKFEDYHIAPEIKRSLDAAGLKKPTDIQFKAIPAIMKGEDVLAIAQTGTGKTAAFAIPVIDKLHKQKVSSRAEDIKCVVMVPTRELAIQITEVFTKLAQYTRVKAFSVFGGVEQGPQIAQLEKGIDVLVSTPGRMFDLVSQGYIKLDRIEILILDEADHMLDLGFIKDIQDLIKFLPKSRQTLFFSATINEKIKKLAYSLVKNAIRIQISPNDRVAKNITHSVAFVAMDDKRFFLERVIKENPDSKILVFVRTKVRAERVFNALERMEIQSLTIHGDKEQADRLTALNEFKKGNVKVLIATDVSARGIDIANVDYVVNYDLPEQAENYVHRVGRTGRGTQKGRAVSFCSPDEKPMLEEIQTYLDKPIDVLNISTTDYSQTIDFTADTTDDLKSLMKEVEDYETAKRKKKKK